MGENEITERSNRSIVDKFRQFLIDLVVKPVDWVRENVVEPNQKEYYWYHERLPRVPTVDQCYTDDYVCIQEAQEQYIRDKLVEKNIVQILKKRYEYCQFHNQDEEGACDKYYETWQNALTNFFTKYSDLGLRDSVITCYMKQKHRMAFERRHGPVGGGKKVQEE